MKELKVTGIYCYPIKGCAGISLEESEVQERGLIHDRRWMLVDGDGQFISQRSNGAMALIHLSIRTHNLTANFGEQSIEIPFSEGSGKYKEVTVWGDQLSAELVGVEFDQWFSNALELPVHLVRMTKQSDRSIGEKYTSTNEQVSFADGMPYLIVGESSLSLLNEKLGEDLKMNRFRPNIVFEGGSPHIEDVWKDFRVGEVDFVGVKNCARCQVTTIDQETGRSGKEPLKTLSTYRKLNNKILFGQNAKLKQESNRTHNTIKVGDTILVNSFREGYMGNPVQVAHL